MASGGPCGNGFLEAGSVLEAMALKMVEGGTRTISEISSDRKFRTANELTPQLQMPLNRLGGMSPRCREERQELITVQGLDALTNPGGSPRSLKESLQPRGRPGSRGRGRERYRVYTWEGGRAGS